MIRYKRPMKTNAALEAAICAAPDDDTNFLVYGDWLCEQGEPHGQLVAVQHRLAANPTDPELQAAEERLLTEHVADFFGPPQIHAESVLTRVAQPPPLHGRRGIGHAALRWPLGGWRYGYAHTQWHLGFLRGIHFDTGFYCDDDESMSSEQAATILTEILARPSARFVQEISIGDVWGADFEEPELKPVLAAVAAAPCAPYLKRLLGQRGEHDISGVRCDASGVWATLPALEQVLLTGYVTLGAIALPKLRHLAIHSGNLSGSTVAEICTGTLPALEDLELWMGREYYGGSVEINDLAPIFGGTPFPALKRLGLMNSEFGDAICQALVGAPIVPRLEALDLTMGVITDEGAKALIDNASTFAHLNLRIAGYFSKDIVTALEAMGAVVERRGDPNEEHMYTQVGE